MDEDLALLGTSTSISSSISDILAVTVAMSVPSGQFLTLFNPVECCTNRNEVNAK